MEIVDIELRPIHWDLLALIRTFCYEGLPETKLSRIDPNDFRLPLWDPNPYKTRLTLPNGVPEPFVSSCYFAAPDCVAIQRWGGEDYNLRAALQYLIDRRLLGIHHDNQPVCAAFRNFFGDSEILSTVVIEENENGRFYVWCTPATHLMLKQDKYPLTCCLPFAVFKLTETAQKLLDAKRSVVAKPTNQHKPAGGRPSLSESEARKREELVNRWRQAKAARVQQKDFCDDESVTLKYLIKCINWVSQRTRRSKTS